MTLLILGVALWMAVHLLPSLGRDLRQKMIDGMGEGGYKGLFSLSLLAAIGLMVLGWRSAEPFTVYIPPAGLRQVAIIGVVIAFLLMAASGRPSRIGRVIRHPQLTGVLVWAISHLLANGDSRSVALFGGFAFWSVLEMVLISRREGAWQKPDTPPIKADIIGAVVGLLLAAILVWAHPWIAGVPIR